MMGPDATFFLSQDDKARVPLGLPASQKHVRMAMHLQYRVSLPDHDWVVAERHKLIPSVYAGCIVGESRVLCVGPTFVSIRSGKHDKSTAKSHLADFHNLVELEVSTKHPMEHGQRSINLEFPRHFANEERASEADTACHS